MLTCIEAGGICLAVSILTGSVMFTIGLFTSMGGAKKPELKPNFMCDAILPMMTSCIDQLRSEVADKDAKIVGMAERIADQAELLSRRAEEK